MVVKIAKKRGNPNLHKGMKQPANLVGQDFAAHPERINKLGGRINTMRELQEAIRNLGAEEVEATIGEGKNKKKVKTTRMERVLIDWFESLSAQKQANLLAYGWGVPKQEVELSGSLKTIVVTIKKKENEDGETNG
jgi:hypothetical protein